MQTGYKCYLRITERSEIRNLIKNEIKRLTKVMKDNPMAFLVKQRFLGRKRRLAEIISKMEHLDAK